MNNLILFIASVLVLSGCTTMPMTSTESGVAPVAQQASRYVEPKKDLPAIKVRADEKNMTAFMIDERKGKLFQDYGIVQYGEGSSEDFQNSEGFVTTAFTETAYMPVDQMVTQLQSAGFVKWEPVTLPPKGDEHGARCLAQKSNGGPVVLTCFPRDRDDGTKTAIYDQRQGWTGLVPAIEKLRASVE